MPSRALRRPLVGRLVKKHRRLLELEEDEHHHPGQQDEELHRDFQDRVKEQAEPAAGERAAGEIALDLRLIGPEVGKREKETA